MDGLRLDFGLLLEPLGFIKVLEWIFSIFTFATCGGFQGETTLLVSCKDVVNKTVTAAFAYPFRLNTVVFSAPDPKHCGGTWTDVYLKGNFSSYAQFFVTLAVLVFLYCIAALVVYIGYKHVYRQNNKLPLTDFTITVITAFLWLFSTFAWAKALADIKMSTGASIIPGIESCKALGTTCRFASVTSMGTLNVSVVFGFLNTVLWVVNIWFMYKDNNLHNQSNRISRSQGTYPAQTGV
ncbi:synaptophysin-like protein 1 [Falco biarmicus]|uniref:synaptophysin-like protein 1 n=1 Tax=Falco peregrinus TaxID=8954 RepID=UPI000392F509|nr:synaptophysin-like protein 1 [Falco peregrinus]XP_005433875.1 synaptophysin-like protein 1 [Falco cherrug]XP_037246154.1 synaptophysin-like protein 1 [Falco rusticolus]XP_056197600.1 synaptophysin-like protein 1 [Falco biarmicus]